MQRNSNFVRNAFACALLAGVFSAQAATVSGTIYRDIDDDGTRDLPLEITVANARVHAVDNTGAVLDVVSNAAGVYTVTLPGANLRLEFLPPVGADFFEDSIGGGTAVRFTSGNQLNVDVGFAYPGEFCQLNPNVTYSTFANGNPLGGGSSGTFNWFMQGPFQFDTTNNAISSTPTPLLGGSVIGSTYGLAFSRTTRSAIASAFVKRHAGLGTGGLGGIYRVDLTATDGPDADPYLDNAASLLMDLDAAPYSFNFGTLDRSAAQQPPVSAASAPNRDIDAFDKVGRVGIGEMALSDDERTLWLINLNTNDLLEIPLTYADVGADGDLDPVPPPDASTIRVHPMVQACTNGVFRAFAVEVHQGRVFVGGVCNAQATPAATDGTANLVARVFSHMPGGALGNFTQILSFPLNYPRGYLSASGANQPSARWLPWLDAWTDIGQAPYNAAPYLIPAPDAGPFGQTMYPQPILATLQFDADGALYIGMMDRFGHQVGNNNFSPILADASTYEGVSGGDSLLACPNAVGVLVMENNATCGVRGPSNGAGQVPSQGFGSGEFYWQDMYAFAATRDGGTHQEINLGGNALNAVTGEFATAAFDPRADFRAQGYVIQNARVGNRPRSFQVFGQDQPSDGGARLTGFGKAAGLGNVELQCSVAPLQIGNRIWNDADNDGVQDPGEAPIAGVALSLFDDGGALIARALTDAAGNYFFRIAQGAPDGNVNDATATLREPYRRDYRIVTDAANFGAGQPLAGRSLAPANADASANGDARDSDFGPVTGGIGVVVAVGDPGEVDHSIDGGFVDTDFGDLPDTAVGTSAGNYNTLIVDNGPQHPIIPGLRFGAAVDMEINGQPNAAANGDDTTGVPDDEDGANTADLAGFVRGSAAIVRVTATNQSGLGNAFVCGFADFNGDGDFLDAGEVSGPTTVADGTASTVLNVNFGVVPATAPVGSYARFRISTSNICTAVGVAPNGEVEDYPFAVASVADVAVVKTGPASAVAGGPLNYSVLVTNNGPSAANGAILTDPVVPNYTVTGVSCGAATGGAVCPAAPTVAQLQGAGIVIPTFPSGGTLTFTITGTAGNGASVTNTANIAPPVGTTDPVPGNNTDPETTPIIALDFGDLPDTAPGTGVANYNTLLADNGPRHPMTAGLRLGATLDTETDGQPNVAANGDGADEDGANLADLAGFVRGGAGNVRVTATNQSGLGNAFVCGFADFNGDGDFGDASEVAGPTTIADGTASTTVTLSFGAVPATAVSGSYARFRISTSNVCSAVGAAANGEVEDYPIAIAARDFGDLPDTAAGTGPGNYETLLANGGAFHRVIATLRIGATEDSELDGQPNAAANGDGADEDGVNSTDLMFTGGLPANVRVTVTNTSGAATNLCGFVDFNADGDFGDASEAAIAIVPNGSNGSVVTLAFGNVPLAAAMSSYSRFRLGTAACALGANGDGGDGEVEDYVVSGMARDFGDLPDTGAGIGTGNYETLLANGGAFHQVVPTLRLGATEDVEADGQPNAAASGDGADEDGINTADLVVTGGAPTAVRVTATNTSGAPADLCGFLDFNGDGDFADNNEVAAIVVPNGSNGAQFILLFDIPPTTPATASYGRFRLGTAACAPNGNGGIGEVEDYPIAGAPQPVDRGDLPDTGAGTGPANYETLIANNGPSHPVVPGLRIGATIDGEANGQPNATATGDGADEDGINVIDLALTIGAPVNVRATATNTTSGAVPARICGFVDFNGDGDFADAQESAQIAVPAGSNNQQFTLAFGNAPSSMTTATFARFRLSTDAAPCTPNGNAPNGEVEDYTVAVTTNVLSLGNLVFEDANNNGTFDAGEVGIDGVPVTLFRDSNNDGVPDGAAIATQNTAGGGLYLFAALTPDTYIVEVAMPTAALTSTGTGLVYALPGPNEPAPDPDNDVNNDDNGTRVGATNVVRSLPVTLGAGQEPVNDGDASANSNLSVDFGFLFNFDLALQKRLGPGQPGPFRPSDIVTFDIQIYNQGAIVARNIVVTDYIPNGLELVDAAWAAGPNRTATRTIAGPLAPGTSTIISIRLRVDAAASGTLVNVAEISAATDGSGNPRRDIDSVPDGDPDNEGPPRDDELGNMDGDQDDSDPAPITLAGGPPMAIPTLDPRMLALLAALFALVGGAILRRRE